MKIEQYLKEKTLIEQALEKYLPPERTVSISHSPGSSL